MSVLNHRPINLSNQNIYYPGTDSRAIGAVYDVYWNNKEAWGTVGSQERPVTGSNVKLDGDGVLISAEWSVVEERRGG